MVGTEKSPAPGGYAAPARRPAPGAATLPGGAGARLVRARTPPGTDAVRDMRGRAGGGPGRLSFAAGDLVVVSGLPGSGKSTLMGRAVVGTRIDSQDTRERVARRVPRRVPYLLYRPLVRLAHYARLRRALRTGAGVVVHDCGTQTWVRRWLAREARRRDRALHLLLLDVEPKAALAGQRERGRAVSRYAFRRHRRAVRRLMRELEADRLPPGCATVVLLDRPAADSLRTITFVG